MLFRGSILGLGIVTTFVVATLLHEGSPRSRTLRATSADAVRGLKGPLMAFMELIAGAQMDKQCSLDPSPTADVTVGR